MRTLKIESLSDVDWINKDKVMIHACFQILKDFIEDEEGDTAIDYKEHKEFVDEVRFLYNWWETRKDQDNSEQDDEMLLRLMKIRTELWT
jgi:SOS response regulatory protein OraA/RecX